MIDTTNKILMIFDVDGTLADCEHRLHHIKKKDDDGRKKKARFDLFEAEIPYDSPILPVVNIYKRMVADPNIIVVLLTGRGEKSRELTEKWFTDHGLNGYDALYMKPRANSSMPDTKQKRAAHDQIVERYGMPVAMVFEDRDRVIDMWKEMGVFVFNVNQNPPTGPYPWI